MRQGVEPGIWMHFVMWDLNFLKEGGRLGMIISDSWLQTDYGVDFGKFLLDNFKVKALIDISSRVFPIPSHRHLHNTAGKMRRAPPKVAVTRKIPYIPTGMRLML